MRKFVTALCASAIVAALPAAAANAAILGPDAAACASGSGPAVLVKVTGFKRNAGMVRARAFSGAQPASWFDKKRALKRTEVAVPRSGVAEICLRVPRPGGYVIDVRHDLNANGDTDKADGAGASGNPNISVFDFFLGKKPPASKVVVQVSQGVRVVPITVKYIQGGSFKAVAVAAR